MDSAESSWKRSAHEETTSRKRSASILSDTCDSESGELYRWQQSSISWKKSYDRKVAQCLARKEPPIGPVEQYLNLISSIRIPDSAPNSTQSLDPSVAPLLLHSTSSEVENRRENLRKKSPDPGETSEATSPQNLTTKTHPERVVLAPETPGIFIVPDIPSALPGPETPGSVSSIYPVEKAHVHVTPAKLAITTQVSDRPQARATPSRDIINSADGSPSARQSSVNIGQARSLSEASNNVGLHHTTSGTSASTSTKVRNTKTNRSHFKVKEVDTLDAYDRLTAKERLARFPRVDIWADFLARTVRISPKRPKIKDFMKRCRIYYLIDPKLQQNLNDADRMRMRKLFEVGAQIQPELKAKHVTHIIVRDGTSWNACFRAIKAAVQDPVERQTIKEMCLSSVDKIAGEELIWVMDFKWVTSCLSYGAIAAEKYTCIRPRAPKILKQPMPLPVQSPESQNANRSAEADHHTDSSYDEIETSICLQNKAHHQTARNPKIAEKNVPGLENQLQLARLGEGTESDDSEVQELDQEPYSGPSIPGISTRKTKNKARQACDKSGNGTGKKNGPNEDLCLKLEKILELYGSSPHDNYRIHAIRKALNILRTQPKRVDDFDTLRKLEGIGPKTARRILKMANTSTPRRLQLASEQDVCRSLFKQIYGVDDNLALEWYTKGLRTLDDVRDRKSGIALSPSQELGLRFFNDLQERIPRREVECIFDQINKAAVQVDTKLKLFLMGSFRRGEENCGDIEVMITRDDSDGKTYQDSLSQLYRRLREDGLITHELSVGKKTEKKNQRIFSCLCAVMSHTGFSKQRRLDLLGVPFSQLGAALIYFTGNEIFNRSLRLKARQMGYTLKREGLFAWSPSAFQSKFNHLLTPSIANQFTHSSPSKTLAASRTEEEIFKILNVPFLLPHQRNL